MRLPLAATIALVAFVPSSAGADANPAIAGTTCGFAAFAQGMLTGQSFEGVIASAITAFDTVHLEDTPVSVSIKCELLLAGTVIVSAESVGNAGAAVVLRRTSFDADPDNRDPYTLCTRIVARSASGTKTVAGCDRVVKAEVYTNDACAIEDQPLCESAQAPPTVFYVVPHHVP